MANPEEYDAERREEERMAARAMTITCGRLTVEEILDGRGLAIGVVLKKRGDVVYLGHFYLGHDEWEALKKLTSTLWLHEPVEQCKPVAGDPTPTLVDLKANPASDAADKVSTEELQRRYAVSRGETVRAFVPAEAVYTEARLALEGTGLPVTDDALLRAAEEKTF